jgi:hypothetical protein
MRIARPAAVFAALVLVLVAGVVQAKDFRTSFVRLVPETDWKPAKGQAIALEVANRSSHEKSAEFATAFEKELTEQLGRVLGYAIDPKSSTKIQFTVEEFDPGNAGMRLGLGFGGKAYVGGAIEIRSGGQAIGALLYSFRPNSPGAAGMAREAAAGLALKLSNGERDEELHPMKGKKN